MKCIFDGNKFKQTRMLQQHCGQTPECIQAEKEYHRQKQREANERAKPKTHIQKTPLKRSQKPIAKLSGKKKQETAIYLKKRIEFLNKPENKVCFIEGCNASATTIEHRAGRWGKNFLDESTWAGCCLKHNLELENNSELSKKYQLSKIHGGKKGFDLTEEEQDHYDNLF